MSQHVITLGVVVLYLLLVLGVGEYARRSTRLNREDYFMASRSFGTLVLLFALLATNMTAFVMIGAPGLAYRAGIGTYGYVNGIFTLVFPLMMATVGYRLWLTGKKFGHITPGEMFDHRFQTKHLGTLVMVILTVWTVPYILLGAIGAGLTLNQMTGGAVPYWAGSLIILLVVFSYVMSGGMRGTAWTNVLQGFVFMVFLWGLLIFLGFRLGGFTQATAATMEQAPQLATRSGPPPFSTKGWLSFSLVLALDAIMFPHLFRRILTGLSEDVLKRTVVLYPIGLLLVWVPPVIIGFWGAGQVTDLAGQATDQILPLMVANFTPPILAGFAIAGILAAVMSSIDGQTLTISTLISEDLISKYIEDISERREVFIARATVGVLLAVTFVLSLLQPGTIVGIAEFAFSGFALTFFPLMVGLYWRGATGAAAWIGLAWGFVGLWLFQVGVVPMQYAFGFMPFVPVFVAQVVLTLAVGYLTDTPSQERVGEYFELFDGVW